MKYALAIQHTTSKQCYAYILDESPNSNKLYYKFNIEVGDIPDGEYQYILIENPGEYQVVFNNNRVNQASVQDVYILVSYNDILTQGTKILVVGKGDLMTPTIVASGLMRVGDYTEDRTVYNKKQEYICYDGS